MSTNFWSVKKDWIHFTAIAGVATGQIAAACARQGLFVTGSTGDQFYEPMKSFLLDLQAKGDIKLTNEFSYKSLLLSTYTGKIEDQNTLPTVVLAQGGLSLQNKELQFAEKRGVEVQHYAQYLGENCVVRGGSIVVAGSFGKTTTTGLIIKILENAGLETSYMVGAIVADIEDGVKLKQNNTQYSVIEGDEYISARWDMKSKFFHYAPNYLVLTGYAYDHTDIFKTPQDYFNNFKKLITGLGSEDILIFNNKYPELKELASYAKSRVISYAGDDFNFERKLIGNFNKENIAGAVTLAKELKIAEDVITRTVASYIGPKRRLESRWDGVLNDNKIKIIDDFGATPAKAKSAIAAIRAEFPQANIISLFEPNFGSRTIQALSQFDETFGQADKVLLLPFTAVNQEGIIDQQQLASYLHERGFKPVVLTAGDISPQVLAEVDAGRENIILFLSSHSIDDYYGQVKDAISYRAA
jgi:UDP-N-acetylmuramate: L-alanyl-gamma-D-glutamyl-meso-diaminopimelate ligase